MGKENVKLNTKQVDEIIDLITIEEKFENEDKLEKALAKHKKNSEELIDTAKIIDSSLDGGNTTESSNKVLKV